MRRIVYPLLCTVVLSTLSVAPAIVTQEVASTLDNRMEVITPDPSPMVQLVSVDAPQPQATWSFGDSRTEPSGVVRGLSLRDARRMGLTIANITKSVKKLKASGEITADSTDAEVAALVAQDIFKDNKAAWGDPKAVNWDSVLALIEKLLPIIMLLLGL